LIEAEMTIDEKLKAFQDRLLIAEEDARKAANAEHIGLDVKRLLTALEARVKQLESMHADHARIITSEAGQRSVIGNSVEQLTQQLAELKARSAPAQ
jgi:hypothetical protein